MGGQSQDQQSPSVHRPGRLRPHRHQHQRQEQREEKFEYGSREADQAAQKLQSLGAMVYPPGNKTAIDWGILAGGLQYAIHRFHMVSFSLRYQLGLHHCCISVSVSDYKLCAR